MAIEATAGWSLVAVGCPTGITGLGGGRSQVDVTCLDSQEMEYEPGMANPSAVTVNLNFDPAKISHQELWNLFEDGTTLHWVIGLSDGTAAPTIDTGSGTVTYPTTRSWIDFNGYISDFPFDAAINNVYKSAMQIQRSGARTLHVKA
jgi:hypothetical protein